jgi:hypothetical protein
MVEVGASWDCAVVVLLLCWGCACCCAGAVLLLCWGCAGAVLGLCWGCAGAVLALQDVSLTVSKVAHAAVQNAVCPHVGACETF